jgi:FlaA1/EpsC-like NDP-sugar epimerase
LGNVLGSNGSVTKIFSEQIARGGPITITHPDMERFFMTIPEASELILQASAMGKDSEIFVVDMGEPVNIVDLARNLICLSGLRPDEDIRIVYTGAHAGEKLSEELSEGACTLRPTIHDRIKVLVDSVVPRAEMHECLARLRTLCTERKRAELLSELMHAVPEYRPSSKLLCGVHSDVDALMAAAETA